MAPALAEPSGTQVAERDEASVGARYRDLRIRFVSAAVLAPTAVACVWFGGWAWAALVLAASTLLGWEWARLRGPGIIRAAATPLAIVGVASLGLAGYPAAGVALVALSVGLSFAGVPLLGMETKRLRFGVPYVAIAALSLIALRDDSVAGRANLIFLFVSVWACDIGAYGFGRALGGRRLAPSISPGKTWSGAIGGLGVAVLAGIAVAAWLDPAASTLGTVIRSALVAAVLAVATQAGDLFESRLKRLAGAKDSGRLIPGHGGALDRLDGLLAAAPVAALISTWVGAGIMLWR